VATYGDYVGGPTRVTRAAAPAAVPAGSLAGREASPRFSVGGGGHPAGTCNAAAAVVSARPPAYLPYASMAMTPSDIMRQQICYQGSCYSTW